MALPFGFVAGSGVSGMRPRFSLEGEAGVPGSVSLSAGSAANPGPASCAKAMVERAKERASVAWAAFMTES